MTDLMILAVDQRPWLTIALYGHPGPASPTERAAVARAKHVVLDGLLRAVEGGVDRASAAILVDEDLGPGVAERARAHGITLSMPLEVGGREVYEDAPADLPAWLAHHRPDLAKVLVRYNPEGDAEANEVQLRRLATTSAASRDAGCEFLFELLVPPTSEQLARHGDEGTYDDRERPALTLRAVEEIAARVDVDVWKLEHMGDEAGYRAVTGLAREHGGARCVVLGAGAPVPVVEGRLATAARAGFTGFAVGRSIWWDAVRSLLAGEIGDAEAAQQVAARYSRFVTAFASAASRPVAAGVA